MPARPLARTLAVLASLLWVAAAVTLVLVDVGRWRSPAGGLPHGGWLTLAVVSATCLVAAAWATASRHARASAGFSVALAAWLLPVAAGFGVTPSWAKTLVLALPPLLLGSLTEVGTGLGRHPSPSTVRLRRLAWACAGAASVVLTLAYDPFGDPSCRRTCLSLPVVLGDAMSTKHALTMVGALIVLATLAGLGAVLPQATSWSVRAAALALLATGGGLALVHLVPGQTAATRKSLDDLTALALLLPSAAVVVSALVVQRRRRGVERLAAELTEGSVLSGVEFAVGTPPRWVDAEGRRSTLPERTRATELADDRGPVVRWVGGAASTRTPEDVAAGLHPATWLALDNARLAASARAKLADLRASQQRIVATSDAERLRIGRDLHDQTQQRLVGASLHLRLAAGRCSPETAEPLLDAERRLRPVLEALRAVSHGPFPDVLAEEGLAAALADWAADAGDDVRLSCPPDLGRLPAAVERAAYAAVAAVAATQGAQVTVERHDSELVIEITRAGPQTDDLTAIRDRVGATGGILTERPEREGWTTIEVVLPCGS